MRIDKAAETGMLPPCGMGRVVRSVRTPMGIQHAWRYEDTAWITYGDRVRMVAPLAVVIETIEREAVANAQPRTIGWEVAHV